MGGDQGAATHFQVMLSLFQLYFQAMTLFLQSYLAFNLGSQVSYPLLSVFDL